VAVVHGAEFRRRYRDELHHASVAVGLNTSGMIDAAVLGTPVCTVELPELAERQRGTVHYEYLMKTGHALLRTSTSFEEHVEILGELARRDPYSRDERSRRFVQSFVRPHGTDVSPGTFFADEALQLLASSSELRMPGRFGRSFGRIISIAAPVLVILFETGRRRRFFDLLSRATHLASKRARHFVLVVLPVGIRVRLIRLRLLRPATPMSVPAALGAREVNQSAEPIPAGRQPAAFASPSPPVQGAQPR
jgi:hypothetical protein